MPDPNTRIPPVALALGLAGLLPFAAGLAMQWVPLAWLGADGGIRLTILTGALLLAFLGGIRWGAAIGLYPGRRQSVDFVLGASGVAAGLAAALIHAIPAVTLLIAGFLVQALWDVTSVESGRLPLWFGRLRMLLTAGAVVALIAVLAGLSI